MILIASRKNDISTISVIKWLLQKKKAFVLLTEGNEISQLTYNTQGESIIKFKDRAPVNLEKITSYWYRKGANRFKAKVPEIESTLSELDRQTKLFIRAETNSIARYLDYHFQTKRHLNTFEDSTDVNKLILCDIAHSVGLKTPPSLITDNKASLLQFFQAHKDIITKPLEIPINYLTNNHWIPMYTEQLTLEMIQDLPDQFNLSLFQKKIEKKYELRIFCLEKEKYSMAIFSQRDAQTTVDFRKYNFNKPNRNVPFRLPPEIDTKIDQFLEASNYKCGSIDMLVDPNDHYYFLEINPVGQFGMVSIPCNYNLEKKIAEYLCKK